MKKRKPNGYWTRDRCLEEATKYSRRFDFKRGSGSAFNAAVRGGFLDEICSHMVLGCKPVGYWTKERCLSAAAEFETISEFESRMPHILNKIRKNKWNLDSKYKKVRLGNRHNRLLYAFEFEDGFAYVGLSYNPEARRRQHLQGGRSPVYEHLKISQAKFVIFPEIYHKDEVGKKEGELILKYEEAGWIMLNRGSAGGLGSGGMKWTKEKIREKLREFSSLSEFQKQYKGAYSLIYRYGWQDIVTQDYRSHFPRGHWTKESCLAEAQRYKTRKEFREGSSAAADFATRKGWMDEICVHMEYATRLPGYWTKERCTEELMKIRTMQELKAQTELQSALYYHGWHEELTGNLVKTKMPNGYWTIERCAEEAKRYMTKNEFRAGSSAAYSKASKRKWLSRICEHMVLGR